MTSHRARKQRAQLRESTIRIDATHELCTLKRSAKKRLEQERLPKLWIFPGDGNTRLGGTGAQVSNSVLRLPTELRQDVLYMSYSVEELERDVATVCSEDQKRGTRLDWSIAMSPKLLQDMGKAMRAKFGLRSREGVLVAMLNQKISEMCRVAPKFHQDMAYVAKRWHADLEEYVERNQLRVDKPKVLVVPEGYHRLHAPDVGPLGPNKKDSRVIKLNEQHSKKKIRPRKCWYCTERHFGDDPVCPMARIDPKGWNQLTRKVSGRRGQRCAELTFHGERVVLES
jgi:hypothetical protein